MQESLDKGKGKIFFANKSVKNKKHLRELGLPRFQIFFKPQQDITAFELAQALPFLTRSNQFKDYPVMPESVRRHFFINQIY